MGEKAKNATNLKKAKKLSPFDFSIPHQKDICLYHNQVKRRNCNELPSKNHDESSNNF